MICVSCFPDPIDWARVTAAVNDAYSTAGKTEVLELPEFLRRDIGEWPPFDQTSHQLRAPGHGLQTNTFRDQHPLTAHDEIVIAELTKQETERKKAATHDRLKKAGFITVLAFLMFTRLDGHKVWVNSDQIITVQGAGQLGHPDGTLINNFVVRENVNEVIRAIRALPEKSK